MTLWQAVCMAPGCAGSCYISENITLCTLMETFSEIEKEREGKKWGEKRNGEFTVMELN